MEIDSHWRTRTIGEAQNLRRVISALMPERFWIDNEPSIPKERLARFRYLCH